MIQKTYYPSEGSVEKRWYLVDADGKTLGRVASRIASILRGKHKPVYTPGMDTGDFVVVINAERIRVTGKKLSDKLYYSHSGYPGGLKAITLGKLLQEKPEEAIRKAVWGMLPKGRLGRRMYRKLKVYSGPVHPHSAQKPEKIDL